MPLQTCQPTVCNIQLATPALFAGSGSLYRTATCNLYLPPYMASLDPSPPYLGLFLSCFFYFFYYYSHIHNNDLPAVLLHSPCLLLTNISQVMQHPLGFRMKLKGLMPITSCAPSLSTHHTLHSPFRVFRSFRAIRAPISPSFFFILFSQRIRPPLTIMLAPSLLRLPFRLFRSFRVFRVPTSPSFFFISRVKRIIHIITAKLKYASQFYYTLLYSLFLSHTLSNVPMFNLQPVTCNFQLLTVAFHLSNFPPF